MGQSISGHILAAIHLAFWSQLGVLVRIYLDLFFTNRCSGGWGVCLLSKGERHGQLGSYFVDLASNMLGSFVMGLLTATSALDATASKSLAVLPESHVWQDTPELLIGLRTGFCGSLTTFASWEFSLVLGLIGGAGVEGGQWAEFLWGLVVGLQLALSSYMFGVHTAGNLEAWQAGRLGLLQPRTPSKAPGIKPPVPSAGGGSQAAAVVGSSSGGSKPYQAVGAPRPGGELPGVPGGASGVGLRRDGGKEALGVTDPGGGEGGEGEHEGGGTDGWADEEAGKGESERPPRRPFARKTTVAVTAGALLLTALWIVLAVVDDSRSHSARRRQWFALLMAPFGAYLRWKLALLNGSVKRLAWFPFGTLAANLLACCIDFLLQAGLQYGNITGYWPVLMFGAVRVGFSGSLSTVSTFVAEVHKLPKQEAFNLRGPLYAFITLALGALSGVCLYGWSVWA